MVCIFIGEGVKEGLRGLHLYGGRCKGGITWFVGTILSFGTEYQ